MNWRLGSKVVCINDDFWAPHCVPTTPVKGKVYVLRGLCDRGVPTLHNLMAYLMGSPPVGLLLREITNPPCVCITGAERGFDQAAFEPLIEDESQSKAVVEELKKLAETTKVKKPEKVK